jgi:hypothetical protein
MSQAPFAVAPNTPPPKVAVMISVPTAFLLNKQAELNNCSTHTI